MSVSTVSAQADALLPDRLPAADEQEEMSRAKEDSLRGDWQAVADRLIPFLESKAARPVTCLLLARAGKALGDAGLTIAAWDEFAKKAPHDIARLREAAGMLQRMGEKQAALRYAELILAENHADFEMALIIARAALEAWDIDRAAAILALALRKGVANALDTAEQALKRKDVFLAGAMFLAIRTADPDAVPEEFAARLKDTVLREAKRGRVSGRIDHEAQSWKLAILLGEDQENIIGPLNGLVLSISRALRSGVLTDPSGADNALRLRRLAPLPVIATETRKVVARNLRKAELLEDAAFLWRLVGTEDNGPDAREEALNALLKLKDRCGIVIVAAAKMDADEKDRLAFIRALRDLQGACRIDLDASNFDKAAEKFEIFSQYCEDSRAVGHLMRYFEKCLVNEFDRLQALGDSAAVLDLVKLANGVKPDFAGSFMRQVQAHIASGDIEAASALLKSWLASNADVRKGILSQARAAYREKDSATACAFYAALLAVDGVAEEARKRLTELCPALLEVKRNVAIVKPPSVPHILTFGGCQINVPLSALHNAGKAVSVYRAMGFKAVPNAFTPRAVLQLAEFCRTQRSIPREIRRLCWTDELFEPSEASAVIFEKAETVLIELNTPTDICFDGFYLAQTQVREKIVDRMREAGSTPGKLATKWLQDGVLKGNEPVRVQAGTELLEYLPDKDPDDRMLREVVKHAKGETSDRAGLRAHLEAITSHMPVLPKIVVYYYSYMPDARVISWPPTFVDDVVSVARELNMPVLDPAQLVAKHGTDSALKSDLRHYAPEFLPVIGEEILNFAAQSKTFETII